MSVTHLKTVEPEHRLDRSAHRLYAWFSARPDMYAVLAYSALALAFFVVAYYRIFSQFQPYDDEGTLLTTVQAFVDGGALYSDVYSPYGPFYYEIFGAFFSFTGWAVTTDASRLIVLVLWVLTSILYGFVAHRLSGRLAFGASSAIVAFSVLSTLVNEPMHPHGLASLLIAGFVLLAVCGPGKRTAAAGFAAGALLGGLLLTKINLGAFAVAAVVLAAALALEPLRRRRWIRWPVIAGFLALPIVVMARDLQEPWTRDFVTLELLASLALVVAASTSWQVVDAGRLLQRWLTAGAVGVLGLGAAVIAGLLVLGISLGDLYQGIVSDALRIRDAFVIPFELPPAATDWGIAAVAGAAIVAFLRSRHRVSPGGWDGALRVVAGLVIWVSIAQSPPFNLDPDVSRLVVPLILGWVAAVPLPGTDESAFFRFVRILLPALAISQVLQVYPVAGNQQGIAAVTFVPVGALCIADGLRSLAAWSASRGSDALIRFSAITLILSVALVGKFGVEAIVRPGITGAQTYGDLSAVDLPGTSRLRLPAQQAYEYKQVATLLRENRCSTFVSFPGLNSFYLWSSLAPLAPQLPGPWIWLLDDKQQRKAIDQLRAADRACAIRNDSIAAMWLQGRSADDEPLFRYLTQDFRLQENVGGFQFLVRASGNRHSAGLGK
jgi:hypothetical protein